MVNIPKKKTHEKFINEIKLINPNIIILSHYNSSKEKVLCKCIKDNYEWKSLPSHLLKGHGCPKCANKVKTHDEFVEELKIKNKNIEVLDFYINSTTKMKCKCKICNKILNITPNALLSGKGCYDCNIKNHIKKITKTHEQFINDISIKNDNIKILGNYKNSHTNILSECNICGYRWSANPSNLLNGSGCPKCAGTLKKTHREFIEQLSKVNQDILILSNYINSKTEVSCQCKKCDYIWDATPDALINAKTGCPNCNGGVKKSHEDFIERIKNINPNIEILGNYKNSSTKILCKCKICLHEWTSIPNSLLNKHGCPHCDSVRKRKTHQEFINEISNINSDITILGTYVGISEKILCQCNICRHIWEPVPDSLLRGHGCPLCNKSHGERFIDKYLLTNKIYNIPQKTFDGLTGVNGGNLSYDFYLPNHNMLIEFQGLQHAQPVDFKNEGKEKAKLNFEIQQEHDKRKREYAELHNINLLEIWYYDLDNIDEILDKKLLNKSI